jgi:hypothetical protein
MTQPPVLLNGMPPHAAARTRYEPAQPGRCSAAWPAAPSAHLLLPAWKAGFGAYWVISAVKLSITPEPSPPAAAAAAAAVACCCSCTCWMCHSRMYLSCDALASSSDTLSPSLTAVKASPRIQFSCPARLLTSWKDVLSGARQYNRTAESVPPVASSTLQEAGGHVGVSSWEGGAGGG